MIAGGDSRHATAIPDPIQSSAAPCNAAGAGLEQYGAV